jgi:hypothetical protein
MDLTDNRAAFRGAELSNVAHPGRQRKSRFEDKAPVLDSELADKVWSPFGLDPQRE